MREQEQQLRELAVYKYGFRDEDARYEFVVPKGLSKEVVEAISHYKGEPDWMRKIRLQALEIFLPQADAHLGCRFVRVEL